ncbi:MAG: ATP synthase F1 subunit delta [Candidatus Omnitrophica bacterium]|nr:ATP synthase F1 subunit delta [Candidatus Omnitrophota bacterium]
MSELIAAKRYMRALFNLASRSGDLAAIDGFLTSFTTLAASQPKFRRLMTGPILSDGEKHALVKKLLPQNAPALLDHFLGMLIAKKRCALLPDIQKLFHVRYKKSQGIQEVEMISASPLSAGFREKLRTVLTKKFCAIPAGSGVCTEVRLLPRTDAALLGGFVLRFNEKEIDCSFKTRIEEILQKLFGSPEEGTASC